MKTLVGFFTAVILLGNSAAQASFEENARRYLSGQEILWSLSVFFDFSKNPLQKDICTNIQSQNSGFSGANSPNTGEPISPAPNQGTVLWILGCVQDYLSSPEIIGEDPVRLKQLVGDQAYLALGDQVTLGLAQPWSSWSAAQKQALVRHMVKAFLGSDHVIQDFGFIEDPDEFRARLLAAADFRSQANVLQIVSLLAVNLAVRDEFLSY